MKKILFIFLSFFWFGNFYSQILRNVPLNLNAGGEVFDAVYVPQLDKYLLVGSFTSINGQARNKHAFLTNNGQLDPTVITTITAISGNIHAAGVSGNNIILGGNFTITDVSMREGFAKYTFTGSTTIAPVFTLNSWNMNCCGLVIWDFEPTFSNSFTMVGDFTYIQNSSGTLITRNGLAEISVFGTISNKFNNQNQYPIQSSTFLPIHYGAKVTFMDNNYYCTGYGTGGEKFNNTGVHQLSYSFSGPVALSRNFVNLNDSIVIADNQYDGNSGQRLMSKPLLKNSNTNSVIIQIPTCSSVYDRNFGSVTHNGNIFQVKSNLTSTPSLIKLIKFSATHAYTSVGNLFLNLNPLNCLPVNISGLANDFNPENSQTLFKAHKRLFVSDTKITGTTSLISQGLLQYCLEPENPKPFLTNQTIASIDINGQLTGEDLLYNPDSVLCPGQIKHYEIPASIGASGYKWKYTGTGLKYSFSQPFAGAPVSFFNTLNDSILSLATNANQIWIYVDANYSNGQFSVTPYDTCNFASQYLWAKTKVINFSNLPLPNIQVADSLFFTCASDSILLQASSTTANVSYTWNYQNNIISNSPNHTIFGSTNPPNPSLTIGNYIIRVKENSTGCISLDTVVVKDTFVVEPITIANFPSLFFCSTDSMILNAIAPNSTLSWFIANDTFNILSNPLTIYDTSFLQFTAKGIHNVSSCVTYQNFDLFPFIDQDPISGKLSSHPNYPGDIIIDTISCLNSLINAVCVPDPSNPNAGISSAQWIINGSNAGNTLNLTPADSMGMNLLQTKVYSFQTENGYNGCLDTFNAVVLFQLEKPFVDIYLGPSTTNCSFDTLTLSHPPTLGTTLSQGWLNGNTNTLLLDTLVQNSGTFVFEVIDNSNGCVNYDTVVVSQTLEMVLLGTPDTLVCPDLPFSVTVQPQNVFDPVIYNWSNGSTTNSSTGIGGVDTLLTVTGTSSAGCVGLDTVLISISEPIVASFQGFTQCGSPNGSIQVLTTVGGTGDYSYSMDNVNFTDSTNFGNLPMDSTYTFFIQDSIGCVYDFQTTLDATAQSPSMDFLMQTYNVVDDTIVAVNISAFQGFDSIAWFLPSSFDVLSVDDSMLVFHVSDTGNFEITMVGYQDTCAFEFSKFLRVDFFKPEFSDLTDTLGITSFLLSPNPTTGTFGVDVSFGKIQNFSIVVLTNLGQTIPGMSYSGNGNAINLPLTFPLGIAPGNYRVRVICEYDTHQQSIVKQ